MKTVAVLFARSDSIYKTIEGCDVWDQERDALKWAGGAPVIAHPPCKLWGGLRAFAKSDNPELERSFGTWSIDQVREFGGVLEHPARSTLWKGRLPRPSEGRDKHGGYTVPIAQWWFGHRAEKWTWLYICGIEPTRLPEIPYRIGLASHVATPSHGFRMNDPRWRPQLRKPELEKTPIALAHWLVETARRCAK